MPITVVGCRGLEPNENRGDILFGRLPPLLKDIPDAFDWASSFSLRSYRYYRMLTIMDISFR